MIFILPASFIAALYFFSYLVLTVQNRSALTIVLAFILTALTGLASVLFAIFYSIVAENTPAMRKRMYRAALAFKLLTVPFFIVNFLVWAMIFGVVGFLPGGQILWLLLPLVQVLTFCVLAVTSSYSVSTVILFKKKRLIGAGQAVLHSILQFLFVIDVLDFIYLFFKFRALSKSEEAAAYGQDSASG